MTAPSDGDWTGQLVRALERVHEVEGQYLEELFERRRERELADAQFPGLFSVSNPARDRLSFYSHACHSEGIYAERRYPPLRAVLENAADIVGQHPALAPVLKADSRGDEFMFHILNVYSGTSRLAVVAGLICRAQQVGKNGYRIASCELKSLLDLCLEEGVGAGFNDLTVGYHVSLFYGLKLSEDIEIASGMMAVPLEHTGPFLNRGVLERVAPSVVRENRWEAVGALLSPVPWKPILLPRGEESEPELDWGGTFFKDARAFIELLSLSHGVPVVTLMDIPYCTHRTALLLLGNPHYHGGSRHKSWASSFGGLTASNQLEIDAFNQAKHIFRNLRDQSSEQLAPVISRLSEALARTGQYASDDKILDVAIALEQMYELDQGEISFKLKTRAACFLESDTQARLRVFKDVEQLYGARSEIVHRRTANRKKQSSASTKREAFKKGFDVARNTVFKLIQEGEPANWNEVVLTARGANSHAAKDGEATSI